jgi:hypothetical protein
MKLAISIAMILALSLTLAAQTVDPTPSPQPATPFVSQYIVNTGASADYATGQSSVLSSVLVKVTSIGNLPTYSVTTFETAMLRTGAPAALNSSLSIRTGVCQAIVQKTRWGVLLCTDFGILHFSPATLGNITGSVAPYVDLLAIVTKGKYHGYLSPVWRQVSIASLSDKPTVAIQIGTTFGN